MIVTKATPAAVHDVALHMRRIDLQELSAFSPHDDFADLAADLTARFGSHPAAWVVSDDQMRPFAVAGALNIRPNVATLLFFATDEIRRHKHDLARALKNHFIPALRLHNHRIEAVASDQNNPACRWLEALGFRREATHLGYGKRGEAFAHYVILT